MVDEQAFYVASQNLYPSAIGNSTGPELNEYGFLVDDAALAAQMRQEYWDPIWGETVGWTFQPEVGLRTGTECRDGEAWPVVAVGLSGWDVVGDGDGRIKVTWETETEMDSIGFNIYRSISSDPSSWENVHLEPSVGGVAQGAAYEWIDTTVSNGVLYYYWLEEFDYLGSELWGPKSTTTGVTPAPTNLSAIAYGGQGLLKQGGSPFAAKEYVLLSWNPSQAPPDTTFNVYRNNTTPVPLDVSHRIASGRTVGIFTDVGGRWGHYYVVTAVENSVASGPSNTARAQSPCGMAC